jgi:signal transduction histidine kinase
MASLLSRIPFAAERRSWLAHARDAAMFLAGYVALDWASYIYPLGPFNITPWNPPPALSIVWMMLGGLHYAPIVFVAAFGADILIRHAPGGLALAALTSLVLAGGYASMAWTLGRFFKPDWKLRDTGRLWIFVAVTGIGSALVGVLYVGVLWAADFVVGESFAAGVGRFWLGDTVGILVTAPILLVAADPEARQRFLKAWRRPETALQFAVMAAAVYLVFEGSRDNPSKYFYVLFLPLIWIALRGGLGGTALASAIVQVGVVLGIRDGAMQSLAAVELQALVAALSLTGLFLGVMVDERERATQGLKRSLRLAAAGEMAGAIAHEINQPLAALGNYARACQLMLKGADGAQPHPELNATIAKVLDESRRAADVVARLRDFFRAGSMQMERVSVAQLLDSARSIGEKLNASGEVAFQVETSEPGATLLVDRVQIELVLRNLIANAFEAVAQVPPGGRSVSVSARETGRGHILIGVVDTGPGVPPEARGALFEPFSSGKPSGMGLGLAISRAIAEAHGGSLSADFSRGSEFHLVLPIGRR